MNVEARLATATGAAGLGAGALLLSQRVPGTVPMLVVLALAARAAGALLARDAPDVDRVARRQAVLGVAWILAGSAAASRAGSATLVDVTGAHAVAGLGILHGPIASVAGAWAGLVGCAAAISSSALPSGLSHEHATAVRLSVLGAILQAATAAALFCGPQMRTWQDAIPWVACAAGVLLVSYAMRLGGRARTAAAFVFAVASLGLILSGGRP